MAKATATVQERPVDVATVRQVGEMMEGRAWAEREVDQGAAFWFVCLRTAVS